MDGSGERLDELLERLVGPGLGLEIVSQVNGIPKGSRLAVSTSLLASLIAACMRATGQAASLEGPLRSTSAPGGRRAILGEWLGGSGGGWQDSRGVWPGIKLITGVLATPEDPEWGVSRGRLLPAHHILDSVEVSPRTRARLQESLVLVHGGMAQNVGPILEMVTERYLLRSPAEWEARQEACRLYDQILGLLGAGDVQGLGAATTRNFSAPIQTIIPWATNLYTETLIDGARQPWGGLLGLLDAGGHVRRGHGLPGRSPAPQRRPGRAPLLMRRQIAPRSGAPLRHGARGYDLAINERGPGPAPGARTPSSPDYYTLVVPALLRQDVRALRPARRRS